MSWWWKPAATPSSQKSTAASSFIDPSPPEAVASPAAPMPSTSDSVVPAKPALTRVEQDEQEWFSLLNDMQTEKVVGDATSQQQGTSPSPTDMAPHSFYPSEMSCRSSFDYAMFCQSFGGQFVNVYRYGDFRSCSNHWNDFWFCVRTRQWAKQNKQQAIQEHYREKAVKWKTGPSSEDVWEVRTEPVKNPISGNLAELEAELAQLKDDHAV